MFSKRLKELRLSRGLSQVQLGAALSVTKQTVSNWENGSIQPSINTLIGMAKYLGVSTDYLLGLDGRQYIDAEGLTPEQTAHIRLIVEDMRS